MTEKPWEIVAVLGLMGIAFLVGSAIYALFGVIERWIK
jgi:hypothetical protein